MAGRNLWSEIRWRAKCLHCGHPSRVHQRHDDLSDALETDIWTCRTCRKCTEDEESCIANSIGPNKDPKRATRKKLPDPFGGGKL